MLTAELLKSFKSLADTLDVGIIAVLDNETYTIVFVSRMQNILGYTTDELTGSNFERLLPMSVRNRHRGLMESFKTTSDAGSSRVMSAKNKVAALHKNGSEVEIQVSISFHDSKEIDTPGMFLAIVQDPQNIKAPDLQLEKFRRDFGVVVYQGTALIEGGKRNTKKILVWLAGGGFAVLISATTFIKNIPETLNAIGFAFAKSQASANGQIDVMTKKTREEQLQNLILINSELRKYDEASEVTAYLSFERDPFTGRSALIYDENALDSDLSMGEELFFKSRILSESEQKAFDNYDCFYAAIGGYYNDRSGKPDFAAIYCPVFSRVPLKSGIVSLQIVGAVVLALKEPISDQNRRDRLDTALFRLSTPNLEN